MVKYPIYIPETGTYVYKLQKQNLPWNLAEKKIRKSACSSLFLSQYITHYDLQKQLFVPFKQVKQETPGSLSGFVQYLFSICVLRNKDVILKPNLSRVAYSQR